MRAPPGLLFRRRGAGHHDGRTAAGPAGEAGRDLLLLLDHQTEGVQALAHQDVRVLADRSSQLAVGLGLGDRRLLLLLGDAGVPDLGLEGIDLVLRGAVERHQRDENLQYVDLATHLRLHQVGYLLGQRVQGRYDRRRLVVGLDRAERVVGREDLVQGGVQLPGHEAVADVVELAVVAEQLTRLVGDDLPADRVVHAGGRLVADPDGGAVVLAGVAVRLDGRIELGLVLPWRLGL